MPTSAPSPTQDHGALESRGATVAPMTSDVLPQTSTAESAEAEVDELVAALRPRLVDTVGLADVDRLVREARASLGPVRVTTYLPILIERKVRQRVRMAQTGAVIDVREARVTA
jgi:hypothetical protein